MANEGDGILNQNVQQQAPPPINLNHQEIEQGNGNGNSNFIRPPKPLILDGHSANNWKQWIRQYQWFEIATNTTQKPQNVQVATFMSSIGSEALVIFDTFGCSEADLASLDVIKARFAQYFTPKVNITYERYKFNSMVQQDGEKFDDFLTKIKSQGAKCDFGAVFDSLLRDKIIVGIRSEVVREQLLADDQESTLDRVTQRCRASELASLQLRDLKGESASIHAIKKQNNHPRKDPSASRSSKSDTFDCKRCGRKHGPKACPAYKKKCVKCNREGHFAEMCRSEGDKNSKSSKRPQKTVHTFEEQSDDEFYINSIEHCKTNLDNEQNWYEEITIREQTVKVKLDTGAQCNVIPKSIVQKIGADLKESRTKRIVAYGGTPFNVVGEIVAKTIIRGEEFNIKYIVIDKHDASPILGRNSCEKTGLVLRVKEINTDQQIFEGLGCLKDFEYDIDFIENPSFEVHPARRIPYAYRKLVKDELDSMVKQNVIREVTEATPAVSPMVVVKQNGKIRICIDPTDVNKNVIRRHYPLKTLEEITAKIAGSKVFSKLDCKKGFWQIKLSPRTQRFLTFATPWGRYSCVKLPFGLCSAPEIFQQIMTKLLSGIDKAEASMDDILIYATDKTELNKTTEAVIKRIKDAGLTLNKEKCEFGVPKIKFLGHLLSERGVDLDMEKVEAINKLRIPENKTELQRLLGMVTYLGKYIPKLSEITQPLRKLLEKESEWTWTPHQSKAFNEIKDALSSPPVLRFYDVNKDVTLQADASSYALGAAIMQEDQPVAYASRSLTKAELNYPQIEKEALAIKFACKKYHEYVYGKKVTVETDHKPLESIFKKPISNAPPRLQRILLDIAPYSPNVIYKKGETMYLADTLSRDCDNDKPLEGEEFEVLSIISISSQAVSRLRNATENDITLQMLRQYVFNGWPNDQNTISGPVKQYWNFRDEISEFDGVLYKGQKVIIPADQKSTIISQLHAGHQGIQRTLAAARENVFWLNMSKDIIEHVERCKVCEATQRANTKEPLIVKEVPKYPFQIVATDLFHHNASEYLLIVDSYSGFFDFRQLRHTTSKEVIENLKSWFATHGIPAKLESDNGPQYTSHEFKKFSAEWDFEHITSSPKYPQSNGLAERFVQTAKNMLRKCAIDNSDIKLALLNYRNTPRNEALGSPSQRLMSRTTRSLIPIHEQKLQPEIVRNVEKQLQLLRGKQKEYFDRNTSPAHPLEIGDKVRLQQSARKWTGATVSKTTNEPRSFIIKTDDGRVFRRNTSQLHKTQAKFDRVSDVVTNISPTKITATANAPPVHISTQSVNTPPRLHNNDGVQQTAPNINNTAALPAQEAVIPAPVYTRYGRQIKKVVKMNL